MSDKNSKLRILREDLRIATVERDRFCEEWQKSRQENQLLGEQLKSAVEYETALLKRIEKLIAHWNSVAMNAISALTVNIE